jgi:glycine/D-amino acid oxidase-like deaminating enzyme
MSRAIVIGGGIVGLWTAEVLNSRGHEVTIRAAVRPESSYSAAAACVITPLFPWEPHDPKFLMAWGRYRRTIAKFHSIDEGRAPSDRFLEAMPSYECGFEDGGERFLEKGFSVEKFNYLPFAKVDILPLTPPVRIVNHVDDVHTCTFCARFVADFCNTEVLLAWLQGELVKRGVIFEFESVRSLEEVKSLRADAVFNCMGSNSSKIFPDESLYHVRGQSMFIDSDDPTEPFFGIASGHHAIFKHRRGYYIGSYFLERESVVRSYPNKIEYDLSMEFAQGPYKILCDRLGFQVPNIDFNRIRRVNTGIRPFRTEGPRVESDDALACCATKPVKLVHNYGHGAHGWTVGYATAEDAVNVAEVRGWLG